MSKIAVTVAACQAVLAFLALVDVVSWDADTQAAFGLAVGAVLTAAHAWLDRAIPFGPTDKP